MVFNPGNINRQYYPEKEDEELGKSKSEWEYEGGMHTSQCTHTHSLSDLIYSHDFTYGQHNISSLGVSMGFRPIYQIVCWTPPLEDL